MLLAYSNYMPLCFPAEIITCGLKDMPLFFLSSAKEPIPEEMLKETAVGAVLPGCQGEGSLWEQKGAVRRRRNRGKCKDDIDYEEYLPGGA